MKDFWLEEYYKAESFADLNENWLLDNETLVRNRLFKSDDPYYKLNDIKAAAKTILEGEVAEALEMDKLDGGDY